MKRDFKPGDVVRLRAGGPDMTIEGFGGVAARPPNIHIEFWKCVWFEGHRDPLVESPIRWTLHRKVFTAGSLVKVKSR